MILFLGPKSSVYEFLEPTYSMFQTENNINNLEMTFDIVISYGYRHIIKKDFLYRQPRPPINLHISYLPWNRGADPNLWSTVNDTPKGVTIHEIDEGIDTGPVMFQKRVYFKPHDTLKTSYDKLHKTISNLFIKNWDKIREGNYIAKPQKLIGSYHKSSDKILVNLPNGFDTKLSDVPRINYV